MDKDVLDSYVKAGAINAQVREEVLKLAKPGLGILELAEFIEKRIRELGGEPAFPVNVGINDVTAHYTPKPGDEGKIGEGDLVKIDVGVHVNGYVSDQAYTYCSGKNDFIDVAKRALEAGIKAIRPGVRVLEISREIENVAKEAGLGVIINLTGHGLERYVIHGEPKIPNVENDSAHELMEGDVIALEPFITDSNGVVKESETTEIFSFIQPKPSRLMEARKITEMAAKDFMGLPFCRRWITDRGISSFKASFALRQLENSDALHPYPVLKETRGKPVAQAEHTIIVSENPIVTTR